MDYIPAFITNAFSYFWPSTRTENTLVPPAGKQDLSCVLETDVNKDVNKVVVNDIV